MPDRTIYQQAAVDHHLRLTEVFEKDMDHNRLAHSVLAFVQLNRQAELRLLRSREASAKEQADQKDNLSVAWQIPGQERTLVSGQYLSPFVR